MSDYIKCPFCGDGDLDLPGLKRHLQIYCEVLPEIEQITSPFDGMLVENSKDSELTRLRSIVKQQSEALKEMESAIKGLLGDIDIADVEECISDAGEDHSFDEYTAKAAKKALAALALTSKGDEQEEEPTL